MKRSHTFRLAAALALGVCALAVAAVDAVTYGVTVAARWLFETPAEISAPKPANTSEPMQKVPLVRAVAFRLRRLVRRERIEVQPGYRRCPAV